MRGALVNDTRFSAAVHMLVMVSESAVPLSSEYIADSVGTNATYIRKLSGALRRAGIVESRRGAKGLRLLKRPADLTLLDVYRAVCETDAVTVFDVHRNANDECIVGRHIGSVLDGMFAGVSAAATRELTSRTLADCIDALAGEIEQAGEADELASLQSERGVGDANPSSHRLSPNSHRITRTE